MKRLITISVILVIILSLSLSGIFYARGVKETMDSYISEALPFCESKNQAELLRLSGEMNEYWKSRESFLSFYVRHDEIEKMTTNLIHFDSAVKNEVYESASVMLSQIAFLAGHIYERELPNLDNLF